MLHRAIVLLLLSGALAVRAESRPPDVLVLICDQWSPRYLSWDDPQVRTPHLDAIAKEGKIFDRCYTNSPVCMPARISLVTGWYPHNHNVWGNVSQYHLPAASAPMFRDIASAGLLTAQIGKLHWYSGADWQAEFPSMEAYHKAMGLDVVTSISGPPDENGRDPYCQYLEKKGLLGAVARDQLQRLRNDSYAASASPVGPEDYHDVFVTGLATDFIRQQPKEKPLCLVVSLHSPHPPLDAPGTYATMFDPATLTLPANVPAKMNYDRRVIGQDEVRKSLANYLGKIALADDCLGRLVEAMKERGTWDQALFVFTSDHGEMMGSHGSFSKGRFWEESARVPLVVRWPGHISAGRTKALAQMFDVYPTIVEAVGGTLSPHRFARSLLPVATGEKARVRDLAVSEIGTTPPLGMMARDNQYKWWSDKEGEYLFDLETDPLEQHNLVLDPAHHAIVAAMQEKALTFVRSTQLNLSEGYESKVKRVRAGAEGEAPKPKKKP